MMLNKIFLLALLCSLACKSSQQAATEAVNYTQTIVDHLGKSYEEVAQGELLLCYTTDKKTLTDWKEVLVIDITTGNIMYGPQKLNAKVSWHSDRKLLIQEIPGVIEDKHSSESYSYVYNLDTKQKENTTP